MVRVTESRYAELLAAEAERDALRLAVDELRRGVARASARQDQLDAGLAEVGGLIRAAAVRDDSGGRT